jgi:peptidyl-dipeptidase Dcp
VLAEVNDSAVVVDSADELAGLSPAQIAAAADAAKKRGLDGKYVIALLNTTIQPFETELQNRALRERLHRASAGGARGNEFDTRGSVSRVMALRQERGAAGLCDACSLSRAEEETAVGRHRQRAAAPAGACSRGLGPPGGGRAAEAHRP